MQFYLEYVVVVIWSACLVLIHLQGVCCLVFVLYGKKKLEKSFQHVNKIFLAPLLYSYPLYIVSNDMEVSSCALYKRLVTQKGSIRI